MTETMRAAVLRGGRLVVDRVPTPAPGPGQLQVGPLAVGICGSDLSAYQHTAEFVQANRDAQMATYDFDPERDLVLGHEFTAEVTAVGDGVDDWRAGDRLVVLPYAVDTGGVVRTVGYATDYPGGLAERCVVQAAGQIPLPVDADPEVTALTEPLTTGTSAVARSAIDPSAGALVVGCGPVGLGAVAALRLRGVQTIVAADISAERREMAARFGAHLTVDPLAGEHAVDAWRSIAPAGQDLVVFEASGARGMIGELIYRVPAYTRILVVGSGMVDETIRPVVGIYKNLQIQFCGGPDKGQDYRAELVSTLCHLQSGAIDGAALITGRTGLSGTAAAFEALRPSDGSASHHLKVLIDPQSASTDESIEPG